MNCEGYGLLISKWVDGEAKADDARRAEAHVASCAPCRKLADEFRRNAGLLEAALGPEPFGHRIAGGVFGSLARREALWRWGARLGAAAAIILAVLLLRADRNADQKRFHDQIAAALRVVEQMQSLLEQERARDAVPPQEVARIYYPVILDRDGKPVEGQELPTLVANGGTVEPLPALPEKHPGTIAQDRVDAYADYGTGKVSVTWNMDRVMYASFRQPGPPAGFVVLRREDGEEDWGAPLNQGLLTEPKFIDVTARGLTTYEYRVVALVGGHLHVSEDIARLKTPPDLRLEFKGRGTLDDQTSFLFGVHVRVSGKWIEETFRVSAGESIGGPRNGVDFSTGVIFREAGLYRQPGKQYDRQCATLETASGRILLWQGTSALGSREQLDADERLR